MSETRLRVVCFAQDSPPIIYFTNRVAEMFEVALIIIEKPPGRPRRVPKNWVDLREALWRRAHYRHGHKQREADFNRLFGDRWRAFECPRVLKTDSINSPAVVEALQELKPDVAVDHGTSLVRQKVLDLVPLTLNLHWGLSPYYRGVSCTEWALARWDPFSIGVTIHRISQRIDGGGIVVQRRATVTPQDTAHSIDCQLSVLGTDLMLDAVRHLESGHQLKFHDQDLTLGNLSLGRHASPWFTRHMAWLEDNGMIEKMLARPGRPGAEPIIEEIETDA